MMLRKLLAAALLTIALPLNAVACGVCIEDKVAATYDFEVIAKATRDGHAVLFYEITGLASPGPQAQQAIISAVEKVRGIERGSVRVSLEQAALSLVVNAKRHPPAEIKQRIEKALAAQQLGLKLLRTIQKGKLSAPA